MKRLVLCAALLAFSAMSPAAVYKWVDSQGKTQYGDRPPDGVKAELTRRGLNPREDMVGENFKSFHVFDPDGWDLQISNQTKID